MARISSPCDKRTAGIPSVLHIHCVYVLGKKKREKKEDEKKGEKNGENIKGYRRNQTPSRLVIEAPLRPSLPPSSF